MVSVRRRCAPNWIPRSSAKHQSRRHWCRRQEKQRRRFIRLELPCSSCAPTRPSTVSSVSGLLHSLRRKTVHSGSTSPRAEFPCKSPVQMAHECSCAVLPSSFWRSSQCADRSKGDSCGAYGNGSTSPSGKPVTKRRDLPHNGPSEKKQNQLQHALRGKVEQIDAVTPGLSGRFRCKCAFLMFLITIRCCS